MDCITQLTDVHMLENDAGQRRGNLWRRLNYLSFGRPLDPQLRRQRFFDQLVTARNEGFAHLVITGDLTEDGTPAQYEALAETLAASGVAPERVTLLPGNHDLYHEADAFERALDGPLSPFRRTSGRGTVLDLPQLTLAVLDTAKPQHYALSVGETSADDVRRLRDIALFRQRKGTPFVVLQHHSPLPHRLAPMQWIDGLRGFQHVLSLLRDVPYAHVLHGHIHAETSLGVPGSGASAKRIFSACAVVDGASARHYSAEGAALLPAQARGQAA